jgi:hypothetical protein
LEKAQWILFWEDGMLKVRSTKNETPKTKEPISKSIILELALAVFQAKALQNRVF